jgi:hypothetical protein
LLEVADGDELRKLAARCRDCDVHTSEFSEPDFLDVGLTALAVAPSGWRLVSSLPLALKSEEPDTQAPRGDEEFAPPKPPPR